MKRYILFLVLLLVVTLGADVVKVLISDTDQTYANVGKINNIEIANIKSYMGVSLEG